ncbi:hypothetical protein OBK05_02475 [Empedobacter falsenii]
MRKILLIALFSLFSNSFCQVQKFDFENILNIDKKEFKGLRLENDNFKDVKFITPKGFMSESYKIEPYLSYENEQTEFRIKFKYYASSWLFHNKIIMKVGDETMDFPVNPIEKVIKGGISEISDISLNESEIDFLRKVSSSPKDVIIRFEGEEYADQKLYSQERNYLRKLIDFFDKFKK